MKATEDQASAPAAMANRMSTPATPGPASMRLHCLSHTPLMAFVDPGAETRQQVESTLQAMRADLEDFDPEVIFLFAPDHYNGFFYQMMPPFCIGTAASAVGDWDTPAGDLKVPAGIARACIEAVQADGIDVAVSYRMQVDHGFSQPLALLTGSLDRYAVVPIFINSVALPLPSVQRARLLGEAVGRFASTLNKRVSFMASGGLSHNPPVPSIDTAPPEVSERIIAGGYLPPEARRIREGRAIEAAHALVAGKSAMRPLNPDWDRAFLKTLRARDFAALDRLDNASITADAGGSGNEIKTWVAAHAAMNAATGGRYELGADFYQAIPHWIAGFATMQGYQRA